MLFYSRESLPTLLSYTPCTLGFPYLDILAALSQAPIQVASSDYAALGF